MRILHQLRRPRVGQRGDAPQHPHRVVLADRQARGRQRRVGAAQRRRQRLRPTAWAWPTPRWLVASSCCKGAALVKRQCEKTRSSAVIRIRKQTEVPVSKPSEAKYPDSVQQSSHGTAMKPQLELVWGAPAARRHAWRPHVRPAHGHLGFSNKSKVELKCTGRTCSQAACVAAGRRRPCSRSSSTSSGAQGSDGFASARSSSTAAGASTCTGAHSHTLTPKCPRY